MSPTSSSTGLINGHPAKFTYYPLPSTCPQGQRPIDDPQAGLEICILNSKNHESEGNQKQEKIHIPYSELIAILPPEQNLETKEAKEETEAQHFTLIQSFHLLLPALKPPLSPSTVALLFPSPDPSQTIRLTITTPPPDLLTRFLLPNSALPPHLNVLSNSTLRLSIIISTTAGIPGRSDQIYTHVLQPLLSALHLHEPTHYRTLRTTTPDSIKDFIIHETQPTSPPTQHHFILLSGDTSIAELINSLPKKQPSPHPPLLTILPTGTANALSTTLHRTTSPLTTLLLGTPHPLPLIHTTFSPYSTLHPAHTPLPPEGIYSTLLLSWAFHASLVSDSDHLRLTHPGPHRFRLSALSNLLPTPHIYTGHVSLCTTTNSATWTPQTQTHHLYLLATLTSHLEPTFPIAPHCPPLSSSLHVLSIPSTPTTNLAHLMSLVTPNAQHIHNPSVHYTKDIHAIRIQCDEDDYVPQTEDEKNRYTPGRWRRVCVDGMIVELEKGGWAEARMVDKEKEIVRVLYRE